MTHPQPYAGQRSPHWSDQYALHLVKRVPEFTINILNPNEAYKSVIMEALEEDGMVYTAKKTQSHHAFDLTTKGNRAYYDMKVQGVSNFKDIIRNPVFSITAKGRVPRRHVEFWGWLKSVAHEHYPAVLDMFNWMQGSNITFLTIYTQMKPLEVIAELEEFYHANAKVCDKLFDLIPTHKRAELEDYFKGLEYLNHNRVATLSEEYIKARYILQVGREAQSIWQSYVKWNSNAQPLVSCWVK